MSCFSDYVSNYYRDIPAEMTLTNGHKSYVLDRYRFMVGSGLGIYFAIYEAAKTFFNAISHPSNIKETVSSGGYQTLVYCAAVPVGFFGIIFPETTKDFLDFNSWSKA